MAFNSDEMVNFSPLIKSFTFNAYLVAGFTPISRGSKLDYYINRPQGMKGYIINLTLRGEGRVKAGEHDIHCQENELVLFPPGVPHHYGRAESSEFWDHLWIYFIPRPYWVDWLRWDVTDKEIGKMRLDAPAAIENMQSLFSEVIHHHAATEPLAEAMAMNALERVILTCFQAQPISNRHALDPRINALCKYIDQHIAEDINIETLARQIFLSPSRVAHLFKREMNQTVFAWREKQRISRARSLLQSTSLPIAQIAQAVGYPDSRYFSRLFRHHYGISPREYKKCYERKNTI
ncbi:MULTISPECIES: arabinose operon transcriptional regulator AraC [unclassified Brenneria]|uniref:arabinose operon transcriptional regulator AraC n=1 Tax=unclassified Brenneria TaxID=2634434 RepID=UPI0029C47DF8|nr:MULTISPECIES: arabinose operon transcriptional regulator AraC [unclassified Brenneria]MDX5627411.1 arabinose operon transcriptional regulator AraC [Brenneria sp. L3-3Z]MDX5694433.1 arabinose operon transcriptional regulator AraC [Brenneria sp. L4-2C]MEE3661943.1 arabinose operon transcriptional regulator AraC [Brenneria sp. g21c3]